jgi:glycosyltransferase involved in cell wall biosynthesis
MAIEDRTRCITWVLITGEYPPQFGGVADYTSILARALAAAGDQVHVIASPAVDDDSAPTVDGVTVHRLPDVFGARGRKVMGAILDGVPQPRAAVLQYVPQMYGLRGCNIPFALWLGRFTGYPLLTMFHEVSVTVGPRTPLKYRLQAMATRIMAKAVINASDAAFISTPIWEPLIRSLGSPRSTIEWTPVCSNISLESDSGNVARLRAGFALNADRLLLGHFGTYREEFARAELTRLATFFAGEAMQMLFMGRGSERFSNELVAANPSLDGYVHATGGLSPRLLADHLTACDLLIQPFEDGVTARRGSVTAALALGRPIATTRGAGTEDIWSQSGAVGLSPTTDADAFRNLIADIAADGPRREEMSRQARSLYCDRFAIELTADALRRRVSALAPSR